METDAVMLGGGLHQSLMKHGVIFLATHYITCAVLGHGDDHSGHVGHGLINILMKKGMFNKL